MLPFVFENSISRCEPALFDKNILLPSVQYTFIAVVFILIVEDTPVPKNDIDNGSFHVVVVVVVVVVVRIPFLNKPIKIGSP